MAAAAEIPDELMPVWSSFRRQRAFLRRRISLEAARFWKEIPRQKKRFMPVVSYTGERNWMEPAPILDLGWEDQLGLRLRWRFSDVMPDANRPGKVVRIWGYDVPRGVVPSPAMLRYGKIIDPGMVENFRYFWKLLHALHDHYVWLGREFTKHVGMVQERGRRLAEIEEECGVVIAQMTADGHSG